MRQRWESLRLELKTKLQLLQKTLEQDHKQPVRIPVFLITVSIHSIEKQIRVFNMYFLSFRFFRELPVCPHLGRCLKETPRLTGPL